MPSNVGISQVGVVLGEEVRTADELAAEVGARPEVAQRWLGDLKLHVSSRGAAELGAAAAEVCLRRCSLTPDDVPVIIFGSSAPHAPLEEGRRELRVQELIGAHRAIVFDVGSACSESITALRLAALLLAAQPELARALVVIGEQRRARILGYDRETYQPVFSDAGAALMVEREARLPILGFGDASDGQFWDFIADVRREEAARAGQAAVPASGGAAAMDPRRLRLLTESVQLNRLALDRCLASAGISRSEIRHVLLTREGPRIPHAMMRQLGLAGELLHCQPGGPTHAGMADFIISLDDLLTNGSLQPGGALLLGSRSVGATRFCLVGSS